MLITEAAAKNGSAQNRWLEWRAAVGACVGSASVDWWRVAIAVARPSRSVFLRPRVGVDDARLEGCPAAADDESENEKRALHLTSFVVG